MFGLSKNNPFLSKISCISKFLKNTLFLLGSLFWPKMPTNGLFTHYISLKWISKIKTLI